MNRTQLGIAICLCILALSPAYADTQGFYVNNTQSVIIDPATCNNCKNITDNSGSHVFVPTGTCSEWSTFLSNLPSGVTSGACCAIVTWYLDADNDGYYPAGGTQSSCSSPGAGWTTSVKTAGDCDDSNAAVYLGVSRTRYQSSATACGTACASETQTCQANSTWSGTYGATSCTASTRTMYQSVSVACGTGCNSETQTCQVSGSWSGSYVGNSCTASSRYMYQASSVACENSCSGEWQSCQSNGAWTGSYAYGSCTVDSCCTPNSYQSCSSGSLYWYDSCNVQGSQVDACSGNFCSGGNVWSYTGCSGSSCSSSQTQTCSGSYCSGNDLYNYNGCSGGSCTSAFSQTCSTSGSNYCSGSTLYSYNGCSGSSCSSSTTSCPTNNYCSGDYVYVNDCYYTGVNAACTHNSDPILCYNNDEECISNQRYSDNGCSGGACSQSFVEDCGPSHGDRCVSGTQYYGSWTCTDSGAGGADTYCQYQYSMACSGSYCSGNDVYQYTGCGGADCASSFVQTCSAAGNYCAGDGNIHNAGGCSSGACVDTVVQSCSYGCSGSSCNSPPPADCTTTDGVSYSSGTTIWGYGDDLSFGTGDCALSYQSTCNNGAWSATDYGGPYDSCGYN